MEVWRIRGEQEREKLRKKRARKLQKRVKRSGEEGQDGCEEEEVSLSVTDELPVVLAHTFKAKLRCTVLARWFPRAARSSIVPSLFFAAGPLMSRANQVEKFWYVCAV